MKNWRFSQWNTRMNTAEFQNEIVKLDKAHKRAKKELSKQQKAIAKKNGVISSFRVWADYLLDENIRLEKELHGKSEGNEKAMQLLTNMNNKLINTNIDLQNDISTLELKVSCLEQENNTMRKEQANSEKEVQGRIIQSMNDIIVELRSQLSETEEKYNELLKHVINEK